MGDKPVTYTMPSYTLGSNIGQTNLTEICGPIQYELITTDSDGKIANSLLGSLADGDLKIHLLSSQVADTYSLALKAFVSMNDTEVSDTIGLFQVTVNERETKELSLQDPPEQIDSEPESQEVETTEEKEEEKGDENEDGIKSPTFDFMPG